MLHTHACGLCNSICPPAAIYGVLVVTLAESTWHLFLVCASLRVSAQTAHLVGGVAGPELQPPAAALPCAGMRQAGAFRKLVQQRTLPWREAGGEGKLRHRTQDAGRGRVVVLG